MPTHLSKVLSFVVALALLTAACGSSDARSSKAAVEPEATPTSAPQPEPAAESESDADSEPDAVVEPSLEEAIAVEIDDFMAATGAPGLSFAMVMPDDEVLTIARGVADLETGDPVTPDDYFRIGSVTKPITTAVVLQLADEGLLALDATVSSILGPWAPGYDYEDEVTVRQLLNHTSGFFEYPFDPAFYSYAAPRLDEPISPEELIAYSAQRGAQYELGTQWQYTTVGFVAAGLVIEAVTGNSAEDEFRTRIYEPLGLTDAYLAPGQRPPESIVHGYVLGPLAAAITALGVIPEGGLIEVDGVEYVDVLSVPQEFLSSAGWTGGGIEAQADDTAIMFGGLFGDGLVPDAMLAEMLEPTLNQNYGLGLSVETVAGETVYSHGGGLPGFRSHAAYLPAHDVSMAFSVSAIPLDPDVGELAERIVKLVTG